MENTLYFIFEVCPNPDFLHDRKGTLAVPKTFIQAKDLTEARSKFLSLRDNYAIGGGNTTLDCGKVYDNADNLIAHISYNGRVWDNSGLEIKVDR